MLCYFCIFKNVQAHIHTNVYTEYPGRILKKLNNEKEIVKASKERNQGKGTRVGEKFTITSPCIF